MVAPSSPFDREKFLRGVLELSNLGLRPVFTPRVYDMAGHLAGGDDARKAELEVALQGPAKAIILARGGYGSLRFATRLSVAPGDAPQKPVIGYSDATVLHEIWWRAGTPSIHGPMCTQLGEEPAATERLRRLLYGEPAGPIEWQPRAAVAGRTEGILRGGNLATLASLCGTPLEPQFKGAIVLLEDLNEAPYKLDRLLTQLLLSGAFEQARGFVIGDLTAAGEPGEGREETVAERLAPLGVPLVFRAPFGHAGRNQPVAFGTSHALDADRGMLTPLEPMTC